ncbi:MAG: protein kinase [Lachnospiraceae bacterium]|nr:protein kinase [Lachnospiraceae bacterium]
MNVPESLTAESCYPKDFLDEYDQMECLAEHSGKETFLVQSKKDGKPAIATCYDCSVFPVHEDITLLREFDHPGLPHYYAQYENGQMVCVVREYIEGSPLNVYASENQLSLGEILGIAKQLCDILEVLHTHDPQVVHRDIKPENIIVRPDGNITLIDFDIARTVKDGVGSDTVFFGTKVYAPPEQYGFGQTDSRADIYAFGVLLRWMVTGSPRKNTNISADPAIEDIIDRCTAFTPEQRYNDITEVKKALDAAGRHKRRINLKTVAVCTIIAVVMLAVGIVAGIFINKASQKENIIFKEPLIENAVRIWIGKEEGELTSEDLAKVDRLYIYGTRAFSDPEKYYECTIENTLEGPIHTLEDLRMLKNLEELYIVHQGYVDASGIAGLAKLNKIELKHMRLSNVSAIADIPNLKQAILFGAGLSDVTVLQNCPWLETLDIGLNEITNLDKAGRYPNVKNLGLMWLEMDNLDNVSEYFPKVQNITLQYGKFRDLSGLTKLDKLESVAILKDQKDAVDRLFNGTNVQINIYEK